DAAGDQKRVATPQAAIKAGSDILVVGRPINAAADPGEAAQRYLEDIASGLAARDALPAH
ncbi:MAG: orotidine 5'-phosphate decarboxylase / HUMPS family protein, partial [Pseudomonadota bacterium]